MSSKVIRELVGLVVVVCVCCNMFTDFHSLGEGEVDLGVMGGGGEMDREPQASDKVELVHILCAIT